VDRGVATRPTDSLREFGVTLILCSALNSKLNSALIALFLAVAVLTAHGHEVSQQDIELISENSGLQIALFVWLGAKHMVTGYDHLLFLVGVIFLLRRVRDIALYVSLFAMGHSLTLITGVLVGLDVNPYLVDAIIGLSVAYKGFDNLGGFQRLFGGSPDDRLAVFSFGLFHGLGLATKLQELGLQGQGLLGNLLAFNGGIELGQFVALLGIVMLVRLIRWKQSSSKIRNGVNVGLIVAGCVLTTYQLALFWRAG